MARTLSADDAAGLFEARDTFAMPIGPAQPPALLEAAERASHGHSPVK